MLSKLEFDVEPNNSYFSFDESYITFNVDVPVKFVPDNFFTALLFENLEVRVSYVTISDKCGEIDYPITKYVFDRINTPEPVLRTSGELEGYWSTRNFDSASLISQLTKTESIDSQNEVNLRQEHSQPKTIDNKEYKRYYFKMPINCGLAMDSRPLPKDVPLKFIFYRANAEKSLMSIVEESDHADLKTRTVTINDPQLVACMTTSDYYDRKYGSHRIERLDFPFVSPLVRQDIMKEGQSSFKFTVSNGTLPTAMVCLLMQPEAVTGNYRESMLDFKSHNLESVDLQIDSRSIPDYPIKRDGMYGFAFYRKYLAECNFLENTLSAGGMGMGPFQKNNFMVCVENFKRKKLFTGHLTMTLKFAEELTKKLYIVMVPVYQKKLQFDQNLNVTVSSMRADAAEEVASKFDA